ncbi:MAG TPA: O-antigen ligase family protein [Candidatus Acidoferrum sp.]|nr:O-antigen ligase family protein [Candidatus Acidoferrum sp.]
MLKIIEASLIFCVTAAVVAFGGTEPISFALVEIVLLGTVLAALVGNTDFEWAGSLRSAAVPATLIGLVLFQLLPLPGTLVRLLRPDNPAVGSTLSGSDNHPFSSLSIAPYNTRIHLILLVCCVAVFFFARTLGRDRARRRRLVTWLVALGTFEALYGLVQYLTGWQKIFGYVKKYNLEEATGTYINRNHFAGFLEMVIPFGVALVLYENAKLPRKVVPGRSANAQIKRMLGGRKLSRIGLWLFAATVMVAGLFFSLSRMGIISAVASLAVMAAFAGFQRKAGLWFAAGIMACGVILVLWMGAGPTLGRFGTISEEYASVDESRWSMWKDTARLIGGHPLLGCGLGTFPVAFTRVQSTFLGQFVNHAHNDYLELASDLGIPAAAVFFGSTAALLVRVARKAASSEVSFERAIALSCLGSIAAILLHSLTDFNLYIPANALMYSLILGLAASIPAANSGVLRRAYEA